MKIRSGLFLYPLIFYASLNDEKEAQKKARRR